MDSSGTPTKLDLIASLPTPRDFETCKREMVPINDVLQQIAGKWTIFIIGELSRGPRRFSELKRSIEGISQKMLTATLRDMERDGLVTRKVTPIIPPRVDYELTEMGSELQEPLAVIGNWARANRARVDAARQRYEVIEEERRAQSW